MTFGKSFIDTFSNSMQQDKNKQQPQQLAPLSDKAGINKKKTTALQQQIVGSIAGGFINGTVQ